MGIPRFLLLAVFLISSLFSSFSYSYEAGKEYRLTILHTNDHHGRFWKNKKGEYGMAARLTLVEQIREKVNAQGGHVLLLSGGDVNTGVPESDLQNAEPDFKGMRLLKYDAMAIGNHEFDKPFMTLVQQQVWAGFPFLSANIFYSGTEVTPFEPAIIRDLDGLKVAIAGFTTSDTLKISNQKTTQLFDFKTPSEVGKKIIPKLKKENDVVIAVTHMGHYENRGSRGEDDVTFARSLPKGSLDVIVGGHSNSKLLKADIQNGTFIVQANKWGKYVGQVDLSFKDGTLKLVEYKLIPVNLENDDDPTLIAESSEMLDLLGPFQEKGSAKVDVKIGTATGDFLSKITQDRDAPLGRLISHATRNAINADIAVTNQGGVRADLDKGEISYRDVLTVLPFDNTVCMIELTGRELLEYLKKLPRGRIHHFHGGKAVLTADKKVKQVWIGKEPLDLDKVYKIALADFLAKGKSGYPDVTGHPSFQNSGILVSKAVADYIKKKQVIDPEDYMERSYVFEAK